MNVFRGVLAALQTGRTPGATAVFQPGSRCLKDADAQGRREASLADLSGRRRASLGLECSCSESSRGTPPTLHGMVVHLDRAGLAQRIPGDARTNKVRSNADDFPALRPAGRVLVTLTVCNGGAATVPDGKIIVDRDMNVARDIVLRALSGNLGRVRAAGADGALVAKIIKCRSPRRIRRFEASRHA